MSDRDRRTHALSLAGFGAVLVGAVDPLEGSVLICLGSGLVAIAAFLARDERLPVAYWATAFVLIASGVAAIWGLSAVGGIGGSSGRSLWWGVLLLPYLAGWLLTVWGPGAPRWFSWLALVIGLWYLAIPAMILARGVGREGPGMTAPFVLGLVGLVTIAGGVAGLRTRAT